jgi:CubicO group peptidase (beta-lactamase class C family)
VKGFEELASRVAADLERLRIPGAALGIWREGSGGEAREEIECFGVTSLENPLPVTPDTLFQIGSITKTMTATALVMLSERGRLDLDRPLRELLPGFTMADPEVAGKLTTRQLLTHSGGWAGDYFDDFGNGDEALGLMVRKIGTLPQVTPLGAYFSYNNSGFNIASRLLEVLSGKSYEAAMRELLFEPLGLRSSYFYPDDVLITKRFACGHEKWGEEVRVSRPWAIGRAGNGVGGGVLSMRDLLAYARFHLRSGLGDSGERVMGKEAVESMRESQLEAGARGSVGLSWFLKTTGGIATAGHGGATNGQQSYLCMLPSEKLAVAIVTNADAGGIITDKLRSWVLELLFGVAEPAPEPIEASAAQVAEVVGYYDQPMSAFTIEAAPHAAAAAGGRPCLRVLSEPRGGFPRPDSPAGPPDPPVRALLIPGDRILCLDEPRKDAIGDFIRDGSGRVAFLRLGGRIHRKLR